MNLLPGRLVEIRGTHATAIITDTRPSTHEYEITRDGLVLELIAASQVRPVVGDRPTLAHEDLFVEQLGEILAERAGPEALAGFHNGHNNGRTAFREAARDVMRRLDASAEQARTALCLYTYVVDPDGNRRTDPTDYVEGDTLITCAWHRDGPGTLDCAVHRRMSDAGERSSIFYPSDDGPHRAEPPLSDIARTWPTRQTA